MHRLDRQTTKVRSTWLVLIYQTATHESQQQILHKFACLDRFDIIALGTSRGPDTFIVAECPGLREQGLIDRVVTSVDRDARLVHAVSGPKGPLNRFVRGDELV